MFIDGMLGGMWVDCEGYVDIMGIVYVYVIVVKKCGVEVIEYNCVFEFYQVEGGWQVVIEKGMIYMEYVVNVVGFWVK